MQHNEGGENYRIFTKFAESYTFFLHLSRRELRVFFFLSFFKTLAQAKVVVFPLPEVNTVNVSVFNAVLKPTTFKVTQYKIKLEINLVLLKQMIMYGLLSPLLSMHV